MTRSSVQGTRRHVRRSRVFLKSTYYVAGAPKRALLRDLSVTGALLETMEPPALGTVIGFERNGLNVPAKVVWVGNSRFGIQFSEPMPEQRWLNEPPPEPAPVPVAADMPGWMRD